MINILTGDQFGPLKIRILWIYFTLLSVVSRIVFNNDQLSLYTFYVTVFHNRMPLEGCHGLMKCTFVCVYLFPWQENHQVSMIQWKKWNTCQLGACECNKENQVSVAVHTMNTGNAMNTATYKWQDV